MNQRICVVVFHDGSPCTRQPYRGSKWCSACYSWSRTHGWADPNGRHPQRPKNTVMPFLKAAAQATTDECIDLTGYAHRPTVRMDGKTMWASRAVWIIANGDPGDRHALHTCNRGFEGCVNIRHLYLGDNAQNILDTARAGRSFRQIVRADQPSPRPKRPGIRCKVVEDGRRCKDRHPTKDMCSKHQRRQRLFGDPLIKSTHALLRAAATAETDECITLPGRSGRPYTRLNGVAMTSSRAVWVLANGDPGDRHVLHTCHRGDEGCINIRHLYLGDHARNVLDMIESGRHARGMTNGHAKLTEEDVRSIRRRYVRGSRWHGRGNSAALAKEYGVSENAIRQATRGATWGWLDAASNG